MTPRTPTILDRVPTVEPADGLLAVYEFEPGTTEILHHGDWLIVSEIQPAAPDPVTGEPRVYLRLGTGRRSVVVPKIDPATGEISNLVFDVHAGPTVLAGATVLRRARHRSILEVDPTDLTEV